jgi:ABC-type antimicrobial peptide transport system permease subunit
VNITELGLHLGGTWLVIAATIMLVLIMAFLANLIVTRTARRLSPSDHPERTRPQTARIR